MSGGRDSPLFGAAEAAAKGARDLSSFGDKIKSKFTSGAPSLVTTSFPSRTASHLTNDFNIKFVAADDELDIDDILAAAATKRKGKPDEDDAVGEIEGGRRAGGEEAGDNGDSGAIVHVESDEPDERDPRGSRRRLTRRDNDSAPLLSVGDECEVASDDKVDVNDEDGVAVDSNPRDVNKGGKTTSSPIPISPVLLKQSEDKMKRNIMKVLDFQSTKCRSLDNASLSKLIPETDDAKLANASSLSTKDLNVDDSTEAVGEMEVDKEASSPSKKAQGFFDDLQSKFQIKSKELQLSSPGTSRNIIEDLQHRWASHRGSREATPTPEASSASPEAEPSPGTSPPNRPGGGNILDDIKELLNEKREKLEEEMNKRKVSRGGSVTVSATTTTATTTTTEDCGIEESPVEVQQHLQQRAVFRSTSPVQPIGRSSSPISGPASRGHSPSHRSASSKDNSPPGSMNFSEMLARVKSRSKSASEAPNLSPPTSAGVAATCMEASSAQEALENILSEDESDSPPGASDKESVPAAPMLPLDASVVNQPQSFNQNVSHISNNQATPELKTATPTAAAAAASPVILPSPGAPSILRQPSSHPSSLPLPGLFTSMSLLHRVLFVVGLLSSLLLFPVPPFMSGVLFSAIVTTAFWSFYLLVSSSINDVTAEQDVNGSAVNKFEDGSSLPFLAESTFPQLSSTTPTLLTGWLNLLLFPYEPETYHVAQTHCVFAILDLTDATLTLRRPAKSNAVPKRAMPGETLPSPPVTTTSPVAEETTTTTAQTTTTTATTSSATSPDESSVDFVDTQRFRLSGAKVELRPLGLVSKRLFSKKYPIAIVLAEEEEEDDEEDASEELDREDDGTDLQSSTLPKLRRRPAGKKGDWECKEEQEEVDDVAADLGYEVVRKATLKMKTLHLFTRSCREKEEWFQKLTFATQPKPEPCIPCPSESRRSSPSKKSEPAVDVTQSVVFRKATLFETLERDPSLAGTNFEGCLEDDRVEFAAAADEEDAVEDCNTDYAAYLAKVVSTEASAERNNGSEAVGDDGKTRSSSVKKKESSSASPNSVKDTSPTPMMKSSSSFTFPPSTPSGVNPGAATTPGHCPGSSPQPPLRLPDPHLWLNALLTRLFWDFLREAKWRRLLVEKIQKKLGKMHLPYFIDGLRVTEMDLGRSLPKLVEAGSPYLDAHGLWLKMEVDYRGSAKMTLETKMNLMKLKTRGTSMTAASATKESSEKGESGAIEMTTMGGRVDNGDDERKTKLEALFNEDAEDSAESDSEIEDNDESSDSSREENSQLHLQQPVGTSKKILNFIDKVAATKYFQQATEVGVIKKAMEGVSNTRLILSVCVESLVGTLAVNVPPSPSDRLWWGFVGDPELKLSVTPRIGDKELTLTQITDWIESRLKLEFAKILVLPNMDDLVIPLLNSISDATSQPASSED